MQSINTSLISRIASIFQPAIKPGYDIELGKLRQCGMDDSEANALIKRMRNIAYFTGAPFSEVFILFTHVYVKGHGDYIDLMRFIYWGIAINRGRPDLFPNDKMPFELSYQQIKECIIALTDEGGLFYKK